MTWRMRYTPAELAFAIRKAGNDILKIVHKDFLKGKTRKGAKHAISPSAKPSTGRLRPAIYRKRHMGRRNKK